MCTLRYYSDDNDVSEHDHKDVGDVETLLLNNIAGYDADVVVNTD
jgi:hypothetical protein